MLSSISFCKDISNMKNNSQLAIIENLVGKMEDQAVEKMLKNVEMYLSPGLGIFIPYLSYCDYAVSPSHTHPAYSFIYNFTGPAAVNVYQKRRVSPYGKEANICVFSPDVPHEEIMEDQFRSYLAVQIDRDFYENEFKRYQNYQPVIFKGDFFPANELILNILKLFMVESRENLPGKDELLNALALEVTHQLIRHCHHITSPDAKISQKIEINQLINYLNEAFADKITVLDMAEYVNLSPSHFTRIFKEETGFSPTDFLIDLRLRKAKKYLLNHDQTIAEVAFSCGFSSSAYFATCFFKRTGITPTQFRNRHFAV
jgi:AraC-like DNA-binding protein